MPVVFDQQSELRAIGECGLELAQLRLLEDSIGDPEADLA